MAAAEPCYARDQNAPVGTSGIVRILPFVGAKLKYYRVLTMFHSAAEKMSRDQSFMKCVQNSVAALEVLDEARGGLGNVYPQYHARLKTLRATSKSNIS